MNMCINNLQANLNSREDNINSEKLIYLASPLRAATEEQIRKNMEQAKQLMNNVNTLLKTQNIMARVVAPHACLPEIINDNFPQQRSIALEFGKSLLSICSVLLFLQHSV